MNYEEYISGRLKLKLEDGFKAIKINEMLFDWQKKIVGLALERGRMAVFADCGLGKTPMQLDWAHNVWLKTKKPILILAPLAVSKQTRREGEKFGIDVTICADQSDVTDGVNITNYEKLHKFTSAEFGGIVLDESSILKSYSGKYRSEIIDFGRRIQYRLACTATPAPNDYMEFGNHAEFLGICRWIEMLTEYFVHDGSDTQQWRLKKHAEKDFWRWMSSWCVAIKQPSDIGGDNGKFILPQLNMKNIVTESKPADGYLFADMAGTLQERRQARKTSLEDRVAETAKLVNASNEAWLIWCDLNDESAALKVAIHDAVEVKGSDTNEHKENSMLDFSSGKIRVLVTKPKIAGFGMNWQHCHNVVFVGLSDSYESFYQAVRRCWRFGQKNEVNCYIISSDAEGSVLVNIEQKERRSAKMFDELVGNINSFSHVVRELRMPNKKITLPKFIKVAEYASV